MENLGNHLVNVQNRNSSVLTMHTTIPISTGVALLMD